MGTFKEVSNYDELYPGRFLKAGLFQGKKPTLTIKAVGVEDMEDNTGQSKVKAILAFVERPMQLVMCKTNGICLKAMFGKDTRTWVGKRVTLFAGNWNGEECVRIWGSPDIEAELKVAVELPRRKPFSMVMHKMTAEGPSAVSAGSNIDPRIAAGWDILGWSKAEGEKDRSENASLSDSDYLSKINALIDKMNAA